MTTILFEQTAEGIGTLTLNRPKKHNAINAQMIAELTAIADQIANNPECRALVIRAHGKSFCAGGDLEWMRAQMSADRAGKIKEARSLAVCLAKLDALSVPVIAMVHGNVFGGGVGILSICDFVIAQPGLKYALTETKLGLIPATIGPFVIRALGPRFARQVFFTAQSFSDGFALRSGLVSQISDDPEQALADWIKAVLATAPMATARAKSMVHSLTARIPDDETELTMTALADAWESKEAQTRIKAFLEGR